MAGSGSEAFDRLRADPRENDGVPEMRAGARNALQWGRGHRILRFWSRTKDYEAKIWGLTYTIHHPRRGATRVYGAVYSHGEPFGLRASR